MSYRLEDYTEYKALISEYISGNTDDTLEKCQEFGTKVLENDTSPEEIVQIHIDVLDDLNIEDTSQAKLSLHVLQEVMILFGFTFRDYRAMLDRIESHDKEMDVAAQLQETMLKTTIPTLEDFDIGVLSVPAQKVNGDYFNIIDHKEGIISFAIADVIGKGIPAAIAMSMIKFGMDGYGYSQYPSDTLRKLNRVVEKNVNQNMFITMFYGMYDNNTKSLYYSSAGHEPALIYRYETDTFEDIDAKGIVLGVKKYTHYEQRQMKMHENDMLIVYTDGVSELRKRDDTIIDFNYVKDLIRSVRDEHPQDIVQVVYEKLIQMTHPRKKDDLTLFILKILK